VWTNSFCGHPAPAEDMVEAVHRRAGQELGLTLASLDLVLPAFRYEATGDNGIRENEVCPVFIATTSDEPTPEASEVATLAWVRWPDFRGEVLAGAREVSVWCALQVAALSETEQPGGGFRTASLDQLPPAARG
jgi:isopentenyl-diphosphate delta-isomerase